MFCRNTFQRLSVFRRCTVSPSLTGTCDGEYRKTPRTCFLRRIGRINTPSQENQNGQIRYTCVSSFPYSPFASRSLAVSQPISFHTGSVPAIRCRCCRSSRSSPSGRHLWYGFLVRSLSTLAAYPVIQCRCGKRSCLTAVIIAVVVTILMIAPCLLSSVRIYTLCRHILSFCIVKHAVRVYCIYCQLFKFKQFAGHRAFCRKTAILSPVQQLLIFKVVGCQVFL